MTKDEMISFFKSVDNNDIEKQKYPLTMIGHSKEFFNDRHFSTFLDFMIDHKLSQFMTMRKATETIERFKLRFAADKSTD
jgi:methylmalonyl-CoA mutase N-terminal domain/subunit